MQITVKEYVRDQLNKGIIPRSVDLHCLAGLIKRNLETGDEPSQTSLWFTTRYSMKKKVWADSTSEKVYEELQRLESQPLEEGTPPMTEDQRFEAVFEPERSRYIRGRGAGPKPKTSTVG